MKDQNSGTAEEPIAWFESRLRSAAAALDLRVSNAVDLVGTTFRGGELSATTKLNPSDLPPIKYGMKIGYYSMVIGVLSGVPSVEAVRETLRRYRNQCVVARSFLSANEVLDLQLMLIGPRGSESDGEWRALALMVERDERVVRKLAWLRPQDPADDLASFEKFLKRTFLARPWKNEENFPLGALDILNTARESDDQNISLKTEAEWKAIALDPEENPSKIVEAIVEVWKRRTDV